MNGAERLAGARGRIRQMRAYDVHGACLESAVDTGPLSMVQQQFRDEVDVNTIVRRFQITGAALTSVGPGVYGDFTGVTDYESAEERVRAAQRDFMRLPAAVRERFQNSAAAFLDFAGSVPEEVLYAELDLLVPDAVVAPVVPPVVVPVAGVPAVPAV